VSPKSKLREFHVLNLVYKDKTLICIEEYEKNELLTVLGMVRVDKNLAVPFPY
jgi:hypothetical protein